MQHCLVTGGAGFIGSHLVEALLERGDRVSVVDDESTGSIDNLAAVLDHPRLSYTKGTVADEELVHRLVADVDEVYHLAAAVGVRLIAQYPIRTIETNIYTTELLLRQLGQLIDAGKKVKFFMASTSEVYGKNPKPRWTEEDDIVLGPTVRPRWSYGASKAIDEFLALAYWRERELPAVVGRLFNVVGPRQTGAYGMVLPRLVDAALAGDPLIVHDDGRQQRSFAHVSDVVRMILALMANPTSYGGVCNIGSDRPVSILELAQRVIAEVEKKAEGGTGLASGTGRKAENTAPNPESRTPNPESPVPRPSPLRIEFQSYAEAYGDDFEDCRRRVPDLSKLCRLTGLEARWGLDEIIAELVEWKRSST
ncbi:MAG: GDP-mannose 4,6-dehydratase [Pirellulales bacterium]|nr:GDP-mannose 4,6-dehydratase [Pirellulales bacterium]